MIPNLGPKPMKVICPNCGVNMVTTVSSETPKATHFFACILCILFFPLACIPYCVNKDDIKHTCSACNEVLGTFIPIYYTDSSTYHSSNYYDTGTTLNDDQGTTVHHNSETTIHNDTSHCYGGDTGYGDSGDCGGGGGDCGGGGSCD